MSDNGSLFVGSDEPIDAVAVWLSDVLGLQIMAGGGDEVRLRGRSSGGGDWMGFVVRRNGHVEVDPEPEDVQAIEAYPVEVDIRFRGDEVLRREALVVFEKVVGARPDLPVLLLHNLALLVAAYLPGAGTKYFGAGTTPDGPDLAVWEPWVVR
ncbi:hypothetical protein [Kribbella sp. NPDC051770]|uniref:hypothetical protein n=1 Tax=Kribbella sp. NPDC051770 TaxID=3155413 RepID=UPI00341C4DAF